MFEIRPSPLYACIFLNFYGWWDSIDIDKYEAYENELTNAHNDIVEHQIDHPELFYDPYPFEKFEESQLANLAKESLKFYKEQ